MPSLVEKYSPKTPSDLVGKTQRSVAEALLKGIESGNITQKILFCGPSGVGKTSISLIYSNALNNGVDSLLHVNCKESSGIGFVRDELLPQMSLAPMFSDYRVLLLDEIHGLSNDAQDGLLIRLESLPEHVIILAATTEAHKLRPALASRLNTCSLPIPTRKELSEFLLQVFRNEGISVEGKLVLDNPHLTISPDTAGEIINRSEGNIRSLLNFVEQLLEGYYSVKENTEETPLLKLLLSGGTRQEIFKAANNISSYNSEAISLASYAIKVLQSSDNTKAINILRIFGAGLNSNTAERVGFYHKLEEFIETP